MKRLFVLMLALMSFIAFSGVAEASGILTPKLKKGKILLKRSNTNRDMNIIEIYLTVTIKLFSYGVFLCKLFIFLF